MTAVLAAQQRRENESLPAGANGFILDTFYDSESEESEEDPDDEDVAPATRQVTAPSTTAPSPDVKPPVSSPMQQQAAEEPSQEAEESEDEDELSAQHERELFEPIDEAEEPQPDTTEVNAEIDPADLPTINLLPQVEEQPQAPRLIRIYDVTSLEHSPSSDDEEEEIPSPRILNRFTSLVEANTFALQIFADLTSTHPTESISSETSYRDKLFFCGEASFEEDEMADQEETNITVEVTQDTMMSDKVRGSDGNPMKVIDRFPRYIYTISFEETRTMPGVIWDPSLPSQPTEDENPSEISRPARPLTSTRTTLPSIFTTMQMANHAATQYLVDYVRPVGSKIDEVKEYQEAIKGLVKQRDEIDGAGKVLHVEIDFDDGEGEMAWVLKGGVVKVTIEVQKRELGGPLN